MNHRELCDVAVRWLKRSNAHGCQIAMSEIKSGWDGEVPDAVGFRSMGNNQDGSVVVEVKTSRSDFLADFKKPHRSGDTTGIGLYRYYMCPEGLIRPDELPERWGLLYVNSRGHVKHIAGAVTQRDGYGYWSDRSEWRHPVDYAREQFIIVRLLNRIGDAENIHNQLKLLWRENHKLRTDLAEANRRHIGWNTGKLCIARLESRVEELEMTLQLFGVSLK